MPVSKIVEQFTDDDFTLIVYDLATDTELYHGPASEIFDDNAGNYLVVSIDPPREAYEVTLNVDTTDEDMYIVEEEVFDEF